MIRLIFYIALSLAISLGAVWLISLQGTITIDYNGYRMQPSLGASALALIVLVIVCIAIWAIIRRIINTPKKLAKLNEQRRKNAGVQALSDGFIALQAGEATKARKFAKEAKARLPQNSAVKLLEANADLALGDLGQARENFKQLISDDKTSLAALHGLFEQAKTQGRKDVAISFAQKAFELSPSSSWASEAVFDDLIKNSQFEKALMMISVKSAKEQSEKQKIRRKKAILHSAIASQEEVKNPDIALLNAQAALKILPDFVPAALIAARILSNRNQIRKASSLLRRVYNINKHPDIARLYINVQSGISAVDKLKRAYDLMGENPSEQNAAIVLAQTAIDAFEWSVARKVLAKFISKNPSKAICVLMAQIEAGQSDNQGKAREWLSRALNAPSDPTWVADGITSDHWEAISPLDGRLDAFEFKVVPSNESIINDGVLEIAKTEKKQGEDKPEQKGEKAIIHSS